MKQLDFEHGTVTGNILGAAVPMLVAQILNLLYNIVDRIYIARIPKVGTAALGAVGLCFPLIVIITAFSNLYGSGGAPLFSIYRGKKETQAANDIMNTSFSMLCLTGVILMVVGHATDPADPDIIRSVRGSTGICLSVYDALSDRYAAIYDRGGYESIYQCPGLFPDRHAFRCDRCGGQPGSGSAVYLCSGLWCAWSSNRNPVISQFLSAAFVLHFLSGKAELKVRFLRRTELAGSVSYAKEIVSLGTAGFIMQLTNSLVTICCNHVLSATGGDIYISVMTIVSSVRQLVETPISAINDGSSPILSYNYGARRPARVRKAGVVMGLLILGYTAVMWSVIILAPGALIRVFSSDAFLLQDAVPALKQYFAAFIFMDLQYMGQTTFKSLNKKAYAIFFSLLRKVFIVVPLTYFMPYALHMGTAGVFLAEPVSNVIGGSLCFITMLCTVLPELKRME